VSSRRATSDSSPRMALRLRSPMSTGIGAVYTIRPGALDLAQVALYDTLCHTRPVPSLGFRRFEVQPAFLSSICAKAVSWPPQLAPDKLAPLTGGGTSLTLVATVANVALAIALRSWLHVSTAFQPLATPAVASATIIGMVAAIAYSLGQLTRGPIQSGPFLVIATVGMFLSWLPDLAIWATGRFPRHHGGRNPEPDEPAYSCRRLRGRRLVAIRPQIGGRGWGGRVE